MRLHCFIHSDEIGAARRSKKQWISPENVEIGGVRRERRGIGDTSPKVGRGTRKLLMRRLVGGSVSYPQSVARCASNCWPAPRHPPAFRISRALWPGTASFPDPETTRRYGLRFRPGIFALS